MTKTIEALEQSLDAMRAVIDSGAAKNVAHLPDEGGGDRVSALQPIPGIWPQSMRHGGKDEEWSPAVRALWVEHVQPRFKEGESCERAHYFRPRPWVDEYNRGSKMYGFCYVVQPGNHVCIWERAASAEYPEPS